MPRIERGTWSDFLRRYLQMTGESHVADELAPEVNASFTLEQERPEWEFLKNAKLMGMLTTIAGGANPAAVRLRNPTASGVVAIVDQWHFAGSAAAAFQVQRDQTVTDLAATFTPVPRDTRWGGVGATGRSALIGSGAVTAAALGDVLWQIALGTNIPWYWPGPFVLHPGWALTFTCVTNTVNMTGAVQWLEKRLDDLERSFPGG